MNEAIAMSDIDYAKWKYKEGVDIETMNTMEEIQKNANRVKEYLYETIRSVIGNPATGIPYDTYKNLSLNDKENLINSRDAVINVHKLILRDGEIFFTEDFCKHIEEFISYIEELVQTEDKT